MKYKVRITKQPKYQPGGSNNIPSFMTPQVEFAKQQIAKQQIAKKDVPKIKVDQFGIARDQYGNKYYKPHGSNTYQIDPNQGGFWSHVGSANYGWNESDYKDQEFEKMKELLPWNNYASDKYSIWEELGAVMRSPENALNATLTGNYEPWSITRRRLSDPNFDPNSTTGGLLDIFGDPSILKTMGEYGIKKIPALAKYAEKAAKYVANKADVAAQFIAKYGIEAYEKLAPYGIKGVKAMGYILENSGKVAEKVADKAGAFKSSLGHIRNDKTVNPTVENQPQPKPQPKLKPKPKLVNPQIDTSIYVPPAAVVTTPLVPSATPVQQANVVAPVNSVPKPNIKQVGTNQMRTNQMVELEPAYVPVAPSYMPSVTDEDEYEKQVGGESNSNAIIKVVQAYAQKSGVDPKAILLQLQKMQPEQQQEILQKMMQVVQGGDQEDASNGMMQDDGTEYAAYGGQMGYGLDLGARRLWMNQDSDESSQVTDSIEEVPRDQANIEAEGGETALIPYKQDGSYLHKKIKGNRHTEGGVPLNVPEGTFIYSDTKKMKLGGPVLKMFGKSEKSTKKFTPATLAKQYNLDKYRAILNNPKSDSVDRRTAELMIQNYEKKLAQLALVQEGKKGFPQGIPQVSQDYYNKMLAASGKENDESPEEKQFDNEQLEGQETMKAMYGMGFKYGGGLDKYQGDVNGSTFYGPSGTKYKGAGPGNPPDINFNKYYNPDLPISKDQQFNIYNNTLPKAINNISEYTTNPDNWVRKNYHIADNAKKLSPDFISNNAKPISLSFNDKDFETNEPGKINYGYGQPFVSYSEPTIPYNEKWKDVNIKDHPVTHMDDIPYAWTTPDKLNLLHSMINLASIKKPTSFEQTVQFQKPQTYYTDASRPLAANAEQANASRQARAMFAGSASRYASDNGQFGKNSADIIAQTAMQNIGLGNQASAQNTAINNQQIQYDAQRNKRLYDAGVINEQQYQNAMRQARAAVLQSYAQGYGNASTLYNINKTTSEDYFIDPRNGQRITFRSPQAGDNYFRTKRATANSNIDPETLRRLFPRATDDALLQAYSRGNASRYSKTKNNSSSYNSLYNNDEDA